MPRVPRITLEVVRRAYSDLAKASPYFLYEEGRDAVRGCALRVLRREVQIGTRADRGAGWIKVAVVRADVGVEELDSLRLEVRKQIRRLEDEDEEPTLREGRRMTIRELRAAFREEYVATRSARRSPRTLKHYDYLWERHLLPIIGDLRLLEVTTEVVKALKAEIPSRVQADRPSV